MLIYSKSRVYLLKDGDPVGLSASRSAGFPNWTVLIGRTGFDDISSLPDPTLSLMHARYCAPRHQHALRTLLSSYIASYDMVSSIYRAQLQCLPRHPKQFEPTFFELNGIVLCGEQYLAGPRKWGLAPKDSADGQLKTLRTIVAELGHQGRTVQAE